MTWNWAKANEKDVARFVTDEALNLFELDVSPFDLIREGKIEALLEAIYNALVDQTIKYELEKSSSSETNQRIRTPIEVLIQPKQGTCLDLSLLFCGLCLGCNLLPKLVMLEGHALVVVPLSLERKDYRKSRESQKEFWRELSVFKDEVLLKELIDYRAYCIIECTGFAYSKSMTAGSTELPPEFKRDDKGYLTFEQAKKVGRAQLDRLKFLYAIDIEVAHKDWGIKPETFDIQAGWEKAPIRKVESEQNIDELEGGKLRGIKEKGKGTQGNLRATQKIGKAKNADIIGVDLDNC